MNIENAASLLLLALFAVAMMAFGWIGYYGSDDMSYAAGGHGWLTDFPYVGVNHWTLRHTVLIPMALAILVGGISEFTLVLGTSLYFIALLLAVYTVVARHFDRNTGLLAGFLTATLPLMATQSTVVVPDFAEVFFAFVSLALFFEATRSEHPVRLLALAGLAAGFGWLTRETVVFFLFTYGVLFLFGFAIPRRLYFVMAGAFVAVMGTEFLYFTIMEGNPLYRISVDFATHLKVDVSSLGSITDRMASTAGRIEGDLIGNLSRTGSLSVNRFLDPILVVLANQEFMFFYYIAAPAAIWTAFTHEGSEEQRIFLKIFGLTGLIWILFLWLQIGMTLLPRYFMLPIVMIIILFSVWIREVVWRRHPAIACGIIGFLFLTNLMGIYIDNSNPLYAERVLVEFLTQTDEVVHTDPETARRGGFLYRVAGVENRIKAAKPESGVMFFANPKYTVQGLMVGGNKHKRIEGLKKMAPYQPDKSWTMLWRKAEDRRLLDSLLEMLGLRALIPEEIYRRLNNPNAAVAMYRP